MGTSSTGSRPISVAAPSTSVRRGRVHRQLRCCMECLRGRSAFLLYTADLVQLSKRHQLQPHAYADDTQVYGFCISTDADVLQERVAACFNDVSAWTTSNRLQLNPAKTEVLWCAAIDSSSTSTSNQTGALRQCVGSSGVDCARPGRPSRLRRHVDNPHHCNRQGMFRGAVTNTERAAFVDTGRACCTVACSGDQ